MQHPESDEIQDSTIPPFIFTIDISFFFKSLDFVGKVILQLKKFSNWFYPKDNKKEMETSWTVSVSAFFVSW